MEKIKVTRKVTDLGACAYLMMHGFKVDRKEDRAFFFEINDEDAKDFEHKQRDYLASEFHRFDSCLMSLKKWNSQDN